MIQEEKTGDTNDVDLARIAAIRTQTSETRTLVRLVANYLFLECGVNPSANRVLHLIGQGSMVTISDEITKWRRDLRNKLTPKIDVPDLPTTISTKLGELGGEIWELAASAAKGLFEAERDRLQNLVDASARQAEDAEQAAQALRSTLLAAEQDILGLRVKLSQSEETLTQVRQTAVVLTGEVERRTEENRATQQQLAKAQEDFSKELENQRGLIAKAEQRAQDNERKHLLEIDRARQETVRKTEELARQKETSERAAEAAQQALAAAQQQIAELTQKAAQTASDKAVSEANLHGRINTLESQLGASASLLDAARQSLAAAEARERSLNEQIAALRTIETYLQDRNKKSEGAVIPEAKAAE